MFLKNRLKKKSSILLIAMLFSGIVSADISIIVHPDHAASSIERKNVSRIFLGKTKNIIGAGSVVPVDQKEGSESRKFFYTKVVKKNRVQLKSYWTKRVFAGRGTPPEIAGDDASIVQKISTTPNFIGYVDSSVVNDSVKVLMRLRVKK
ncbi:MAG: phosphate ABC transporter substrate-binding protein [Gammaproteobacteria bacterium]|nr:phosphate ABC transporter substrate-binding protein [Gammaproteobacteria bacterium]